MAETIYPISTSGYSSAGIGWSTSTSTIIQGSTNEYSNYYGVLFFNFAAIRSMNVTHRATNIRLRLKSHVGYARTVRVYIGRGMAKDTFTYGARPSAADGTTYKEVSCAANGWCEIDTSDTAWLAALINSATTCFYINRGDSEASYWEGDGAKHTNKPELYIDWTPRDPLLSVPVVDSIPTITTDTKTFRWTDSTDANGAVTPSQIYYSMEISTDSGSTWGTPRMTNAGVSEYTESMKTYLGLASAQYYVNAGMRMRVKARCSYLGSTYESAYSFSNLFAVDYRIAPSAPASLSVDNTAPYEGQSVVFTVGRPANYNTLDGAGTTEGIQYFVQLANGTSLINVDTDVSFGTKALAAFAVGNLTPGISDLSTTLRAYAVTHKSGNAALETQAGPFLTGTPFTVKRFRAPFVVVTAISRTEVAAQVYVTVSDTGFGGAQTSAQILKIEYNHNGAWHDAALGAWSGLTNSFPISGLSSAARYTLQLRATNIAPAGMANKTGTASTATMMEYTPSLFMFKDPNNGVSGLASKALIIGDAATFGGSIAAGSASIQNNLVVGGSLTLDGVARNATGADANFVTGTAGTSGRLAAWNADGDLVDSGRTPSGVSATFITGAKGTSGNLAAWNVNGDLVDSGRAPSGTSASYITGVKGSSGNLVCWNANGDAVDAGLATSAIPKVVNRQDNTTNNVVSNQLIQTGWGWVQGDGTSRSIADAVSFPIAYDDAPLVFVNATSAIDNTNPTTFDDFVSSSPATWGKAQLITTSGFQARISRASPDGGDTAVFAVIARYGYCWIAIGTKARS